MSLMPMRDTSPESRLVLIKSGETFRLRRQKHPLILVKDFLNAFHHKQGRLHHLIRSLFQRKVVKVAFWKPSLHAILSESRKEDHSNV